MWLTTALTYIHYKQVLCFRERFKVLNSKAGLIRTVRTHLHGSLSRLREEIYGVVNLTRAIDHAWEHSNRAVNGPKEPWEPVLNAWLHFSAIIARISKTTCKLQSYRTKPSSESTLSYSVRTWAPTLKRPRAVGYLEFITLIYQFLKLNVKI